VLGEAGYRPEEIAKAGVLADSRWPGRLCGAWRDGYCRIGTFWARALDDTESAGTRYLYLRGASRTNLPPYGVSDMLVGRADARCEITLVEGFFDVHQLRAHGVENVAALGGTSTRPQTFERLHQLGIEAVTLCLDSDEAGREATVRAVEHSAQARHSPNVYVVPSERLAPAKDPDELVRERGFSAWRELLEARVCGITWRAHELAGVTPDVPVPERRAALARAGRWLGTLPPRLALEQEDALGTIADACCYSRAAVERAFRARYWSGQERTRAIGISQER
jgi:DNA primase